MDICIDEMADRTALRDALISGLASWGVILVAGSAMLVTPSGSRASSTMCDATSGKLLFSKGKSNEN